MQRIFLEEVHQYATRLRDVFRPERDAAQSRADSATDASARLKELERRRAGLAEDVTESAQPTGG